MEEITYPIDEGYAAGSSEQGQEESGSNNIKTETEPGSEHVNYHFNKEEEFSRAQLERNLYNSVKIMKK